MILGHRYDRQRTQSLHWLPVSENTRVSLLPVIALTALCNVEYQNTCYFSEDAADDGDLADVTKKESSFDVPELRHNLNMLMELTEEEIIRNDRQIKHLQVCYMFSLSICW